MTKFTENTVTIKKDLLNHFFDGYKLCSQESIVKTTCSYENSSPLVVHVDSSEHFNLEYLKAIELQNCLVADPFDENIVYYIDSDLNLVRITTSEEFDIKKQKVLQLKKSTLERRYGPSILVLSSTLILIADGAGMLYVVHVLGQTFKIAHECLPFGGPFRLLAGGHLDSETTSKTAFVCWRVDEESRIGNNHKPVTIGIVVLEKIKEGQFEVCERQTLFGNSSPCYAQFSKDLTKCMILSKTEIDFDNESNAKTDSKMIELDDGEGHTDGDTIQLYLINQNSKEIKNKAFPGDHIWMFNTLQARSCEGLFAIQNDVDSVLFRISDSLSEVDHVDTFFALAYILESKANIKYIQSDFDRNYVVLCDCTRQLFIYHKPKGQNSNNADQRIVELANATQIYGMVVTKSAIYLASNDNLTAVKVVA